VAGTEDPDELILNCYRLADRFHQNPEIFLDMPLSRIEQHVHYTVKLTRMQSEARKREEDNA
jgi:hypothetical protein